MAITKLQPNAIPAATDFNITLADGSVVTNDIADANITTAKIADAAVETSKIADGHVTHAKLHTDMDLSGKTVTLPALAQSLSVGNIIGTTGSGNSGLSMSNTNGQQWLLANNPGNSNALTLYHYNDGSYDGAKVVVAPSGNVGIGTDSPNTKLEVATSANINSYNDGAIQVVSNSPLAFVAPSNLNPSLNRWGFKLRETTDGDFSIHDYRQGSTRVLIDGAGNVGIGTTNPTSKLDITGAGVGGTQIRLATGSNTTSDSTYSQEGARFAFYQKQDGSTYRRNLDISANGDNSWGGKIRFLTNPDSDGQSVERMVINENGAIGISNDNPYWPKGVDAYHNLAAASDGSTDDFADLITNRGIFSIGRKTYASFSISFPHTESNKAYRFYFGNGDGYCNIYAQLKISGTYSHQNSMGYRIYEIVRMANSGTAIYQTQNNELHSAGQIISNIELNGWGFHSASNRHYIELRHLNSNGNPYYVDFEFYGMTDRSHIKGMQVQKVGY